MGQGLYIEDRKLFVGDGRVRFDIGPMVDAAIPISTRGAETSDQAGVFYTASDVIVVPSLYEPMGYVVLEAMARGRTVIAAKTGGIVEAIEDEISGLLYAVGNISELKNRIERTMDDPELRDRLATAARQRIESRPKAQEVVAQWDDMYLKTAMSATAAACFSGGAIGDVRPCCQSCMYPLESAVITTFSSAPNATTVIVFN